MLTGWQRFKKARKKMASQLDGPSEYYQKYGEEMFPGVMYAGYTFESILHEEGLPYYNVYPSIIPMLLNLDIDKVSEKSLIIPHGLNSLLINMPKKNNPLYPIRNIGLSFEHIEYPDKWTTLTGDPHPGGGHLGLLIESGATENDSVCNNYTTLPLGVTGRADEFTVGEIIKEFLYEWSHTENVVDSVKHSGGTENCIKAVKLACTLCLLGNSPELIQPEVLNADEHKLKGQHNIDALVAKARRRGKYGFTIGKDIEVMPHYRRPHLALVWYGSGKKKSKIIPRKGSIVHRSKVEKIPTGYAMEE